ncbi:MAG: BACON domain-containing protein [Acidobacteria bacterium]|nr:BACON domain-containing protein [Acidobacteriota bacterium]
MTTATGCAWSATSNDASWITVTSGATGSGSGSVGFTVMANTSAARTGTVTIAGQTFTVNQAGVAVTCVYAIAPTSHSIGVEGGTGTPVAVTSPAGCAWTASSSAAWISIRSGASGSGTGVVGFDVAPNTGGARSGTLTIAGRTFTVSQAGCSYSLSRTSFTVDESGDKGSVAVSTSSGCSWTATSSDSWIRIVPPDSGTGNGTVVFTVTALPASTKARTGTITVAGITVTVRQEKV